MSALASASDYRTLYVMIDRSIKAANEGYKRDKSAEARKYFSSCKSYLGFFKFVLDFYGGTLGFMWL